MKSWKYKLHGAEFHIMRLQESSQNKQALDNPDRIVTYLRPLLAGSVIYRPDVENLGIICLSVRFGAIGWQIISTGILDTLLVHPREVFKPAIVMNASSIVIFRNHPSGDPTPSEADVKVTKDLIRAGQTLKIPVTDHLVLGQPSDQQPLGYMSLRELGYFYI